MCIKVEAREMTHVDAQFGAVEPHVVPHRPIGISELDFCTRELVQSCLKSDKSEHEFKRARNEYYATRKALIPRVRELIPIYNDQDTESKKNRRTHKRVYKELFPEASDEAERAAFHRPKY